MNLEERKFKNEQVIFDEINKHVTIGNQLIQLPHQLFENFPDFFTTELQTYDISTLAKIYNTLLMGGEYLVIDDIEGYRNAFKKTSSTPYVLDQMSSPHLSKNKKVFTFYVHNVYMEIPYCVQCDFPLTKDANRVQYSLLPLV